jgi:hypothetical protein
VIENLVNHFEWDRFDKAVAEAERLRDVAKVIEAAAHFYHSIDEAPRWKHPAQEKACIELKEAIVELALRNGIISEEDIRLHAAVHSHRESRS